MEREDAPGPAGRALDLEAAGRALNDVLRLARDLSVDRETLAEELIGPLVGELGLSAATLALAEERAGTLVLRPVAAEGNHAPLTKHLAPAGLDAMAETAQVFADKRPVYEDSAHGGGPQREGSGVGRWRDGLATEAYCLLPLISRGEALGVLGLEWNEPGDFGLHERIALEALADGVALALAACPAAGSEAVPSAEPAHRPAAAPIVVAPRPHTFDLDAAGVLKPAAAGTPSPPPPGIRLALAAGSEDAWWDVVQFTAGRAAVALCVGDRATADSLQRAFREHACEAGSPADVLRACGQAFLREASAASAALLVGELTPGAGALAFAVAGEAHLAVEGANGRSSEGTWSEACFRAHSAPASGDHAVILLPGDRARLRLASGAEGPAIEVVLDLAGGSQPAEEPQAGAEVAPAASAPPAAAPPATAPPSPLEAAAAAAAAAGVGVAQPACVIMPDDRPQPRITPPETDPPLVTE